MQFVRNFTREEVACRCCGRENMADSTIMKFQGARDYLGRPIYMNSGCRCERHNAEVGGKKNSSHLFDENRKCHAGDVTLVDTRAPRPMTGEELFDLCNALREAGFDRLGVSKWYIHADDDPDKPRRRMWLY